MQFTGSDFADSLVPFVLWKFRPISGDLVGPNSNAFLCRTTSRACILKRSGKQNVNIICSRSNYIISIIY